MTTEHTCMYQLSDWIVFLKQKFPENNWVLKTKNRWRNYTCLYFLIYHGCAWLNLEGQTLISTMTGKVTWSVHLVHLQVVKRGQRIARVPLEHEEVEASSPQTSETRRKVGSWDALGIAWGTWCCGACFGRGRRCALVPGRASCWNWSSCKEDQRGSLCTASGYKEPGGLLRPQWGDIHEAIEEWKADEIWAELALMSRSTSGSLSWFLPIPRLPVQPQESPSPLVSPLTPCRLGTSQGRPLAASRSRLRWASHDQEKQLRLLLAILPGTQAEVSDRCQHITWDTWPLIEEPD